MYTLRKLFLISLPAVLVFAQTAGAPATNLGIFTNSADVGDPVKKGAAEFDATNGQYRITGSGANIWDKQDQFQYVWKEMTGNFMVTATMQFLGQLAQSEEHRKAGIMLRQSLDADSPYGDIVIHGSGMPGLQWRANKGEITNTFDMPFDSPGKYKLMLVRSGVGLTVSLAKDGAALKKMVRTEVTFRGPILVGLAVCAHNANNSETVVFSDVTIDPTVPPGSH